MSREPWQTYNESWIHHDDLGFSLDVSRVMGLGTVAKSLAPAVDRALAAMAESHCGI